MSALVEVEPAVDLPDDSIRVLILDPHAITRIGLAVLLQRQPWVSRCLLASDRDSAAELARRHRPEVAIVDTSNAGPFAAALPIAEPAAPAALSAVPVVVGNCAFVYPDGALLVSTTLTVTLQTTDAVSVPA